MSFSRTLLLATAATFLCTASFAQAPAPAAGNAPVTRDQLPALIKEALINDPDILTSAMDAIRGKQDAENKKKASEGLSKYKDQIFNDPKSPSVGAADADVTVVEFFDYHCGYCKVMLNTINQVMAEDKKIRFVFKEFPILSEDSVNASRAALAVYSIAKDKYWDYHTALFKIKGKLDEKTLMDTAKKLGIDTAKLKTEMAKSDISEELDKNRTLADALGIRGTPVIITGNSLFPGAIDKEALKTAIQNARNAAPAKPAAAAAPAPAPAPAPVAAPAAAAAPAAPRDLVAPPAAVAEPAAPAKP